MQTAFLIIITLVGSVYTLISKQAKLALGFFIMALAFVLQIPDLMTGFWVDILLALSLILFAIGVLVIVIKKKDTIILSKIDNQNKQDIKDDEPKK